MFEKLTKRIKDIDAEIVALQAKKEELRNQVINELKAADKQLAEVKIGNDEYILAKKVKTDITYNESLLKERLQERFQSILQPDYRKIKKHLHEVREFLLPIIEKIGSVNKDLVKSGIEMGKLSKKDFSGAFSKTEKDVLYIKNKRFANNYKSDESY